MDAEELGQAVKQARRERGLTQAQLAGMTNVSRYSIMQLESNTYSDLGIRKVWEVLAHLGLTLSVEKVRPMRPTLEEVQEENRLEREAYEASVRRRRPRV